MASSGESLGSEILSVGSPYLVPFLARVGLLFANVGFAEMATKAFRLWKVRLYSADTLRNYLFGASFFYASSVAITLALWTFVPSLAEASTASWDMQWWTPWVLAAVNNLIYLYFGQRHVEEVFCNQQGYELAHGYKTFLEAFMHSKTEKSVLLPDGRSIVSPRKVLLVPSSCSIDKDGKMEASFECVRNDDGTRFEIVFDVPQWCKFFKRRIPLGLRRIPKRDRKEPLSDKDYHYFVYDLPRTLWSSLVAPEQNLDPFLLSHFREDFVTEVFAILKAAGKENEVGIVTFEDSFDQKKHLQEALLSKLEEMETDEDMKRKKD